MGADPIFRGYQWTPLLIQGQALDARFGGLNKQVVVRTDGRQHPTRGSMLGLEAVPNQTHLFDPETGERLVY